MIGAGLTVALLLGTAAADPKPESDGPRTEWAGLPGATYDTDRGTGLALIGMVARIDPEVEPFRYRVEAQAFATFRRGPDGQEFTFQEHYINLDLPGLMDGRLRLITALQYNRQSNAGYYGIGNATEARPDTGYRYYTYDHIYPAIAVDGLWSGFEIVGLFGGLRFSDHRIDRYPGSRLDEDVAAGAPDIAGLSAHRRIQAQVGVLHDTRDDETWASTGGFHEVSVRGGPVLGQTQMFYEGANLTSRLFLKLVDRHLALAGRWMGDVLVGEVPLYLLSEYGGLYPAQGLGGGESIRGLPDRRYHGGVKVMSNIELRSRFLYGRFLGQSSALGLVGFVDTGRVWTGLPADPGRDGDGLGLHTGVGAGARMYWGETFVIRIDHGWSVGESGLYIMVGELF